MTPLEQSLRAALFLHASVLIEQEVDAIVADVVKANAFPPPKGRIYGDPDALEALSRNANRYIYIRDHMPRPETGQPVWMRRGDDLDEAIDAAMREFPAQNCHSGE